MLREQSINHTESQEPIDDAAGSISRIQRAVGALERVREVEKQDHMALDLLFSDDFIDGATMIHRVQLGYLSELIEITDDDNLRAKLIEQKIRTNQAMEDLRNFKKYVEEQRKNLSGRGKYLPYKIVTTLAAGAYPTGFVLLGGIISGLFVGIGTLAAPIMAGTFGVGATTKLAIYQYRKIKAEKELVDILRRFVDLDDVANDGVLLERIAGYQEYVHWLETGTIASIGITEDDTTGNDESNDN